MRLTGVVLALLPVLLLAACGTESADDGRPPRPERATAEEAGSSGGESEVVREIVSRYLVALADRDGETACRLITPQLRQQAIEEASQRVPVTSCPEAIEAAASRISSSAAKRLREVEFRSVKIDGRYAAVRVAAGRPAAGLIRTAGTWRIFSLG